jgi:hypothetical protein
MNGVTFVCRDCAMRRDVVLKLAVVENVTVIVLDQLSSTHGLPSSDTTSVGLISSGHAREQETALNA